MEQLTRLQAGSNRSPAATLRELSPSVAMLCDVAERDPGC